MSAIYWRVLAQNKWGKDCGLSGAGRFALRAEDNNVYLYPTAEEAAPFAPFYGGEIHDLMPKPDAPPLNAALKDYHFVALEKFPGCQIHDRGRWALKSDRSADVYLYIERSQALKSAPFYNSIVHDLQPTPCPELPDDWEDRQRARREWQGKS
jgi:hypothetical protein